MNRFQEYIVATVEQCLSCGRKHTVAAKPLRPSEAPGYTHFFFCTSTGVKVYVNEESHAPR